MVPPSTGTAAARSSRTPVVVAASCKEQEFSASVSLINHHSCFPWGSLNTGSFPLGLLHCPLLLPSM